jgi:hypothetical protein
MQSSLSFKSIEPVFDLGREQKTLLKWVIIVSFWTFFGLLNATQLYLGLWMEGMTLPLWRVIALDLFGWWPWIPATAIVLWLGRRFPIVRGTWWRVLPVHLLACVFICAAHFAVFTYAGIVFSPFGPERTPRSFFEMFLGRAMSQFHLDLLIYAATLGVSYAVSYYFQYRER